MENTNQPTFWQRQFRLPPTRPQIIFDVIFGIIAPVLCIIFDPIVFVKPSHFSLLPGGMLYYYIIWAYLSIAIGVILLVITILNNGKNHMVALILTGPLLWSAIFSLLLGLAILPISILGLVVIIGIFGFTPFVTYFVYLRNSVRSFRIASCHFNKYIRLLVLLITLLFASGIPFFSDLYFKNRVYTSTLSVVKGNKPEQEKAKLKLRMFNKLIDIQPFVIRAMEKRGIRKYYQLIIDGTEDERATAISGFKILAETIKINFDYLVWEYGKTDDGKKRERLKIIYKNLTGQDIEERYRNLID